MTKAKAITLGFFSMWPIVYMFLFMGTIFIMMVATFAGYPPGNMQQKIMMVILPLHFFTIFEIFILVTIYIFYLFKTDIIPQDKKALWAVVLLLGNIISIPIFWYLYIWKISKEDESPYHNNKN